MRVAAIAAGVGQLFLAGTVAGQEVNTPYFFSKSVVTISGTITTKNGFPVDPTKGMIPGQIVDIGQLSVSLATTADPTEPHVLSTEAALLSKSSHTVELTSGGLLVSVNSRNEGLLGSFIKNIFGAAVTVAKVAGGVLMSSVSDAEKKYAVERAEEATRRDNLREAIRSATSRLIDTERKAISTEDPNQRKAIKARVDDLKGSLVTLRAELSLADTHFSAWKSRMEDAKERRFEYLVDVDDLPSDAEVRTLAESPGAELTLDDVAHVAGTLGSITKVARVLVTQSPIGGAGQIQGVASSDRTSTAVLYRAARPVVISVYVLDSDNRPVLSTQSIEFVTGRLSPVMSLAVYNSKWSTKTLGVTFTGGLLSKVSSERESELAGVGEAVGGIPKSYLDAVKQANEILSEQNKLAVASVQGQIDQLKKQKELIEARIASGESADLAAMQAETGRLDAELKLLTSQRALAGAQAVGTDATALSVQLQLLKLQNELAEAQLKQLQLQQQLEETRRKVGGTQ